MSQPVDCLNSFVMGSKVRRLLLILCFLSTLATRVGISQGHNQAFTHEHDVKFLMEPDSGATSSSQLEEQPNNKDNAPEDDGILTFPVRFDPGELDFADQPIGLPVLRKVTVFNP